MNRSLLEKTFRGKLKLAPSERANHRLYYKIYGGQEIFVIPVSRTHRDISDDILTRMAKQCFLSLGEFKDAVFCPMTREEFDKRTVSGWKQKYAR